MSQFEELINNKEIMKEHQEAFPAIEKGIEEIYKKCGIKKYKILTPYYFKNFSWGDFFKKKKYKDITNYSPNNELLVRMSLNEAYFQGNLYYCDQKEVVPVSYVGFPENALSFQYELQKLAKTIEAKILLEHDGSIIKEIGELSYCSDVSEEENLRKELKKKFINFYLALTLSCEKNEYTSFVEDNSLKYSSQQRHIFKFLAAFDALNTQIVK